MLEVAYILVAIALIVCLVYLTITIQKAGRMIPIPAWGHWRRCQGH